MMKVFVVTELVILTSNEFDISSTTHIITADEEKAYEKFEELLNQASKDFGDAKIIVETDRNKYVSREDGYDRIEVEMSEMTVE